MINESMTDESVTDESITDKGEIFLWDTNI